VNDHQENRNQTLSSWTVYILRCSDNSLYTGITNNLERRLKEHNDTSNNSKGAKYTRARQPVSLAYTETVNNRAAASQREYQIKQLTRKEKIILCNR